MSAVIAIDAGTTGVRSIAVFPDGRQSIASYREFTQHFPQPGWVEHDANDIWSAVRDTLNDVIGKLDQPPAAIGITNQRETVVAWSKSSGEPLHRAIVWQDRRTADRCDELSAHLDMVRDRTGLVLDPYFSGSKMEWLLRSKSVTASSDLAFGTIDSFIIWKLSGGQAHVTDPSNASRTMLYNIRNGSWDADLCAMFGVPESSLPRVVASSGRCATTHPASGVRGDIPISGIAGDQQSALFGQACFSPGDTKNTYGTGSFVLMNVGTTCPPPTNGMLTTVAWDLGDGRLTYALEGAIFVTGAAVQWLRDGIKVIDHAAETEPLALSVPDAGGVVVVPAFTGLGSPWWDPRARGTILGITRGTTRAHLARAVVESMVFQTRDVIDAMTFASGVPLASLRVDGGAAVMDLLCQLQANQLNVNVMRPTVLETTAMGAAYLAGLAEGVWGSTKDIADAWRLDRAFEPQPTGTESTDHERWLRGVDRSLNWQQ
jgi:glycerol kinase